MKKYLRITEDELTELVNKRASELVQVRESTLKRELSDKQARLQSLQSQINPHFLYNALECIRGQAIVENCPQIANITQALSSFFRYSISNRDNIVTIQDELENIQTYMLIQQYRFGDRFSFEIDMDPDDECGCAVLPKLTLQPLVENSIVHGLDSTISGGKVVITVRSMSGHISIKVSDNGKGIPAEVLSRMFSSNFEFSSQSSSGHKSIGLKNVDSRVKIFFGSEYGLSINSAVGEGTVAEIYIPKRLTI